jgi:hypothetical protein
MLVKVANCDLTDEAPVFLGFPRKNIVACTAFYCSKIGRFVTLATHFPQPKPAESLRFRYEIEGDIPDSRDGPPAVQNRLTRTREDAKKFPSKAID